MEKQAPGGGNRTTKSARPAVSGRPS